MRATTESTAVANRWGVAIALLVLLALPVYFESLAAWNAVTLAFMLVGAFEWARLGGFLRMDCVLYAALLALLALLGDWWFAADTAAGEALWGAAALFWAIVVPWWLLFRWRVPAVVFGALGMLLLYAAWHAARLLYEFNPPLLAAGLVVVWLFDSASFFVGRWLGRTPLAPTLSPKKTMEGFLGGVFAAFLLATVFYVWLQPADGKPLAEVLAVVFILAVFAVLGDLFESFAKRQAGVKDSGGILGAHGGVLDRIDALLPVLPFVALLSSWLA